MSTQSAEQFTQPTENDILRVEHISKRYGAVTALVDVNLRLERGEVLGLIGDNGAGKSTLIKIICGFQQPTSGRLILNGEEVTFTSVTQARAAGIDVVYQDLALINQLTAAENERAGLWRGHQPDNQVVTRRIGSSRARPSTEAAK